MKRDRLFYYLPRIIAILYTLFLGLFALDVFSMPGGGMEKAVGLFIHLIPNMLLLLALLIAWKHEKFGAVLFVALFLFAIVFTRGEVLLFTPLLVIAALFFLHASPPNRMLHL